MERSMVIQGRNIGPDDIQAIRCLMMDNPNWGRSRLSVELCQRWGWKGPNQQIKDMACRTLLLKLERAGHIVLPARRGPSPNFKRNRCLVPVAHDTSEVQSTIASVMPLSIGVVLPRSSDHLLCKYLLGRYHYLGLKNTVGENMTYLIRGRDGRELACVLFGSAAWKIAPRDAYIGWDRTTREMNLRYVTNNTRFLVLPWVQIPCLASHILACVIRRVQTDWIQKYGYPVYLLETFVDRERFLGTCYKAANWALVGQTKGRTRNDRDALIHAPIKDIYVYPLSKRWRDGLMSC
jgi:hypothetical protein